MVFLGGPQVDDISFTFSFAVVMLESAINYWSNLQMCETSSCILLNMPENFWKWKRGEKI